MWDRTELIVVDLEAKGILIAPYRYIAALRLYTVPKRADRGRNT